MTRRLAALALRLSACAALAAALPSAPAAAAVDPMQRADILTRAAGGLGFSYYWGHGSWLPGQVSTAAGVCTGVCPNCTHSGRYGADCSGYVCKAWAVPSTNSDVTVDQHPYSTADLINDKAGYWSHVADTDVRPGDARVYRTSDSGHTYFVKEVTGAGRFTTMEAKGCAYGILSIVRTDGWVTQRRASVIEPAPVPPDVPEVPTGPAAAVAGQPGSYCTRATDSQGGAVTDSFLVRTGAGALLSQTDAPAALAGAEMCVHLTFASAGTFLVSARASSAGGTSPESAPLTVTVAGTDGGTADAGTADAGAQDAGAADAGLSDAGLSDAGTRDGGLADAGSADAGADGDGDPVGPPLAARSGCGGCGVAGPGWASLLALLLLRRKGARRE